MATDLTSTYYVGRNAFRGHLNAVPKLQQSLRATKWRALRVTHAPSGARHEAASACPGRTRQHWRGPPVRWRAAHRRWRGCKHHLWLLAAPRCAHGPQAVPQACGLSTIRRSRPPSGRVRPAQPGAQAEVQRRAAASRFASTGSAVGLRLARSLGL